MSINTVRRNTCHTRMARVIQSNSRALVGTKVSERQLLRIPRDAPRVTSENERSNEKEQRNCSPKSTLAEKQQDSKSNALLSLRELFPSEVSRHCYSVNEACSNTVEAMPKLAATANGIDMSLEDIHSDFLSNISRTFQKIVPVEKFKINEIIEGVVLVGCWNTSKNTIDTLGTGFVVDKTNGLIATASHIFYDLYFDKVGKRKFGTPIIGIFSKESTQKVFTYSAEIQAVNISTADACILRVTQRFKNSMELNGAIVDRPQNSNVLRSCRKEKLHNLRLTTKCELSEDISLITFDKTVYNGYVKSGVNKNRIKAKKVYKFQPESNKANTFQPNCEIAIECITHDGCSGGPCVNRNGKVIGMLSRTDRYDNRISYLVPSFELKRLLQRC